MAENLSLKQILQQTAEYGRPIQENRVQKINERIAKARERISQIREGAKNTWASVKEGGRAVRNAVLTFDALILALDYSPDARKELQENLGKWGRAKIEEGQEAVKGRLDELRQQFNDRREDLTNWAGVNLRRLRDGVSQRVIQPTVEGAKKVGNAVVTGVETGRQKWEQGKEKAREWGNRLQGFFQRQGERLSQEIEMRRREAQASWVEISTFPAQIKAGVEGGLEKGLAWVGEKSQRVSEWWLKSSEGALRTAERWGAKAENNRQKVIEGKMRAANIRNGAAGLRGES